MRSADVVIAASRLPYRVPHGPRGTGGLPVTDGLFDALVPVARALEATWVGGAVADAKPPDVDVAMLPVPLTADELRDERDGCSGSIVWPLYHDIGVADELDPNDWLHYVSVNRKVAAGLARAAARGAVAWVHGHQLQLVPRMLRKLRPDLRIGFCLHIPFPPHDLFRQLPWRRQLLLGLLGADLIGVPAPSDAHNVGRCVRDHLGGSGGAPHLTTPDGRAVQVRSAPAAVDTGGLADLAASPATVQRTARMRASLGGPRRVFVGIGRFDHTTGLPQRMRAFAELYADGALDPADTIFVQVVTPSRDRPARTRQLGHEVERMVGDINARYGHLGRAPVTYLSRYSPREETVALLRLADVMVATPLRGGMGLVAKEYVACRPGDDGALVLSEFTAVAEELGQAYLVNPYDVDALKRALLAAVTDPPSARSERMRALRDHVRRRDVHAWARSFLADLADR